MVEKNNRKMKNIEREGWNADELAEEATNEDSEDIMRKMLRGDESEGDADERDVANTPKRLSTNTE